MRKQVWFSIDAVNGFSIEMRQGSVREIVNAIQAFHFKQAFLTNNANGKDEVYAKIGRKGDVYTLHPCTEAFRDGKGYIKGKSTILFSSSLLANVVKEAFALLDGSKYKEEAKS